MNSDVCTGCMKRTSELEGYRMKFHFIHELNGKLELYCNQADTKMTKTATEFLIMAKYALVIMKE